MTNKKVLTISLILSCVLLVTIALGGWVIYTLVSRLSRLKPAETPPELREARITVGAEFLSRNQFITTKESWVDDPSTGIGSIEDISIGERDSHPGIDVVIVGDNGAMIVDRSAVKRSQIQYEFNSKQRKVFGFNIKRPRTLVGDIQVIDIEGDGTCEYLARGSLDGAAVFSHQGKLLWSYGAYVEGKVSITDLGAGDVNGDGVAEFIAGWDDIELFDKSGRRGWTQPWDGPLYRIEVLDVDGDGKNEIIHSSGGEMTIRDALGNLVKEVEMPFYISDFHLCTMPGEKQPHILALEDKNVWLVDFNGEVVHKFAAPLSSFVNPRKNSNSDFDLYEPAETSVFRAKGAWVKFKETEPAFLAVVGEFAALDRSVFYVYSAEGKLVYQEVMPEGRPSIAVLSPDDGRGAQELLVGGSETVWRYTAR